MSIYRELLKKDDAEPTLAEVIPSIRGEMEKLAGTIDYQQAAGKRSFLFSSIERNEGTSLIVSQLALALAHLSVNKQILVVDANLRFPSLHNYFSLSSDRGLIDYLNNPSEELPVQKHLENLDIIPAGNTDGAQFKGTGLGEFSRLLEKAVKQYDLILIDSAAARIFSDAVVIAPIVDSILLTISAGISSKGIVKTVIKALTDAGGEVTGAIFNRRKDEIPPFIYRWL
jgi:Mrp family chromosome partitioning ATPase